MPITAPMDIIHHFIQSPIGKNQRAYYDHLAWEGDLNTHVRLDEDLKNVARKLHRDYSVILSEPLNLQSLATGGIHMAEVVRERVTSRLKYHHNDFSGNFSKSPLDYALGRVCAESDPYSVLGGLLVAREAWYDFTTAQPDENEGRLARSGIVRSERTAFLLATLALDNPDGIDLYHNPFNEHTHDHWRDVDIAKSYES